MSTSVSLTAFFVFINPVLWGLATGSHPHHNCLMDIKDLKTLAWQIQAWHWTSQASSMAWRRGTCLWGAYWKPSTSMWRKPLQSGYSKESWVWGQIQGNKLCMGSKPWLLSVLSLGILGHLHWFYYGSPQNHIQWGVVRPPRKHRSGSLSTAGLSNSPPSLGLPHPKIWGFSSASSSIPL